MEFPRHAPPTGAVQPIPMTHTHQHCTPSTGELEKTGGEPAVSSESVERKVDAVWRSLAYSKYVVEESTIYMLPGWTTEVLEVVLALMVTLKPKFTNQNR